MNLTHRLTLCACALLATSLVASAQQGATSTAPDLPYWTTSADVLTPGGAAPPVVHRSAALTLGAGAIPTGLSSFYDYQSNGGSPSYLSIDPSNPSRLHSTMMVSKVSTDINAASNGRRVGYAVSTDGGATWNSINNIYTDDPGLRLGYPYLQLQPESGTPFIAAHGDLFNAGQRIIMFSRFADNDLSFAFTGNALQTSSSGRTEGVIWPAFDFVPGDASRLAIVGSVFFQSGSQPAPLQVTTLNLNGSGDAAPWREIGDSLVTSTSGGRYVMARSSAGVLGVAYYKFANEAGQLDIPGVYLTESTDGGATWAAPTKVFGISFTDELMNNGDQDTLIPSASLDLVYVGEEPHVVSTASVGGLYAQQRVYHWSPNTGLSEVVRPNAELGLGLFTALATKAQPNMNYVSYPTISGADDGKHIVVAFQAASQQGPDMPQVNSEHGFYYFRIWGVGSPDGGKTWGDPFIIQDFAGSGRDSASIEYPALAEQSRMIDGNFDLNITYQARRYPGMYSFTVADVGNGTPADTGPFNEVYQYFQKMAVTPAMFAGTPSRVDAPSAAERRASLQMYPSVASSHATVRYHVSTTGTVSLRVYNARGEMVLAPVVDERAYAGEHEREIDVSSLGSGAYRVVLLHDGAPVSTTLNVVR